MGQRSMSLHSDNKKAGPGQFEKDSIGENFMVFISVSSVTGLIIEKSGGSGSLCVSLVMQTVAGNFEHIVFIFSLKYFANGLARVMLGENKLERLIFFVQNFL